LGGMKDDEKRDEIKEKSMENGVSENNGETEE
jgi:hypothetical protein